MPCPIHDVQSLSELGQKADSPRTRFWKNIEGRRQPFYGPYARKARQAREAVTEEALEAVRASGVVRLMPQAVTARLDRGDAKTPVRSYLRDTYRTVGRRFATAAFQQHKSAKADPVDEWFAEVEAWLSGEEAGQEIRRITDTVRKDILSILSQAREEGVGSERMAQRIEEQIEGIHRQRARVIARTEVITASNKASQSGAASTGRPMEKEWVDSADSRVRAAHENTDGQTRDLDEPYDVNGSPAMYPADPQLPAALRIQCRCVETYEPKDSLISDLL